MNTKLLRMIAGSDGDEDVARAIFSAADELDRLQLAYSHATSLLNEANEHKQQLRASLDQAEAEVKRARLDERQAMTYLSQVRNAAEFEGDFPSLVQHVKTMVEALRAAHEMTKAAWIEGSNAGWKAARGEDEDDLIEAMYAFGHPYSKEKGNDPTT